MTEPDMIDLLRRFPACSIAVVGDVMLDRYIWGRASRISQEAPVPVVQVGHETTAPGGAANVVRNILSLGARAAAFGVIGRDETGDRLYEYLQTAGARVEGIVRLADRITTAKTRVLAGNQQVVRVDREDTSPIGSKAAAALKEQLRRSIDQGAVQAIILEDYAKGVLTADLAADLVELGHASGLIVALDPHPSHPFELHGLDLMTPNRAEAFALAGLYYHAGSLPLSEDKALLEVGRRILDRWAVKMLLVTLGGDGMALFEQERDPIHIPTTAQEVFDVSGAGDTVMAAFVLARLAGATPVQAAHLANHAAGIVVGKVGTASVSAEELFREFEGPEER